MGENFWELNGPSPCLFPLPVHTETGLQAGWWWFSDGDADLGFPAGCWFFLQLACVISAPRRTDWATKKLYNVVEYAERTCGVSSYQFSYDLYLLMKRVT